MVTVELVILYTYLLLQTTLIQGNDILELLKETSERDVITTRHCSTTGNTQTTPPSRNMNGSKSEETPPYIFIFILFDFKFVCKRFYFYYIYKIVMM